MKLYLFDDATARRWSPFRLTRPVGELLFGCLLLRQRLERHWDLPCAGHLSGEELLGFDEAGAPPVRLPEQLDEDEDRLVLLSRFVPDLAEEAPRIEGGATLTAGDAVVGWILPAGVPTPDAGGLSDPSSHDGPDTVVELKGVVLRHPWELVQGNAERVSRDVPLLFPHSHAFLPPQAEQIGDDHPVSMGHGVELEAGVVLDTRTGPIRLSDGVRVRAHTRLEGPAFVGPGTTVLGGNLTGVSIGPRCKIRGEVEESVILGFSNKAHDGFLGHAYLGRWVNLGAMTTNSDLKNNYGTVRVQGFDTEVDTGLLKLGCFFGDHVKTGIGTFLNTGTVIGAGANVFGGQMPPKYVPPFSWGSGSALGEYRVDAFLETATRVMERREVVMSEELRALLRRAWESSRTEREGG